METDTSIHEKALLGEIFAVALGLLEWAEGDTDFARAIWNDAFEEAERIDHNQSLGEPDDLDRAMAEIDRHIDQVVAARQKLHAVKGDDEPRQ